MQNRRTFLKNSGLLAGSLSLGSASWANFIDASPSAKRFGIQLYSLRDMLPGHAKTIIRELAGYGYTQLESYEGPEGIFWNMSAKECGQYLNSLGMQMISTHCDINKDFEKKAADAASIGMKYLICPWVGPQKSIRDFQRFAKDFNEKGKICQQNGIRFAYHNHDYSFKMLDNQIPQEVLLKETDPALVDFEMDIFWVKTAGGDPIDWLTRFPGRFKLGHIKDSSKTATDTGFHESTDLGTGTIDYAKLLPIAKKLGMEYVLMEQEAYPNGTPLAAAKVGADYLKKLKF